jgi:CHAD domain-containing protein
VTATTFLIGDSDARAVVESLGDLGFVFGEPCTVTTTLLDTFDGRLHRAGLRLQLHESNGLELVLSGDHTVPAHLTVGAAPRLADDLLPGPFRARLAALTDVRALMPQIRISTRTTRASRRDATGGVVATARLHEHIRVVDRPDISCAEATIEIREVTGYTKRTRQAVEVLDELGLSRCEADTLSQCAIDAQVDLAGFTATATVPLESVTPAVDGIRAVLANLAQAITANWQGTIDQSDTEFLHDLRIAVRRTRTVIGESKGVLPPAVRDPARDGFAWLGRLTGPARDLDVYLIEWSSYTGPLGVEVVSSLAPVRILLEQRRAEAHIELERALRSTRAAHLMGTWTSWLGDTIDGEQLESRAEQPIGRLVAARIARAHTVLVERGRMIDPASPADQVHDLRKDAKKLRYLLECFGSLLPEAPLRRYVKRLKALQDNLGEHQDAEVHVSMLRAVARELFDAGASPDTMIAIGQLTERLDQQRGAARAEFAERFADYDTSATYGSLEAILEGIVA